ncbi:MAG: nucleotide exchange factor GrpE [Candidatus Thermoplasmatota archaeon]|nr:nucleotide exchange factor GrpE [Candidatus Thermoplasmatota archaeon]MCL5793506.1 nucleotide exchange factor GrpE [Candidatus Thermoplasmatota archaeon]
MAYPSGTERQRYKNYETDMELARVLASRRKERENAMLRLEMARLKERSSSERDKLLRQLAELDNLLRAKEREAATIKKFASKDVISSLLPVFDSLDSAISREDVPGLSSLREQILKALSQFGFKTIEAKGKKYDPYLHEVVGISENGEDGIIEEEIQKGYLLNNEVLRSSKVIVSKK